MSWSLPESVATHQQRTLAEIGSVDEARSFILDGVAITVQPGVMQPNGTDTRLLIDNLTVDRSTRMLELTTGSGVVSVFAGRRGARGIACDINPLAVATARANFEQHDLPFEARRSDVYSAVEGERFDLIVANPPYAEGAIGSPLDHAFYGARALVTAMFSGARAHLRPSGTMLVTYARWGERDLFLSLAAAAGLAPVVAATLASRDGERVYDLYRITAAPAAD